jgi:hypothetical protein
MNQFAFKLLLLTSGALAFLPALAVPALAQSSSAPNFQRGVGGWQHPFGGEFPAVQGSAIPVRQDPTHRFINSVVTFRFADVSNPNLKQWAKDAMKKDNDEVDAGKIQFTASSSCLPAGVPMFMLGGGPFYFLQMPTKVIIMEEGSHYMRQIYLNEPHSAEVKLSWLGESVGRYEGDTLVVDTIGLNGGTVVDSFRTPHTDKLHVEERWHLIDGGNTLEVNIAVDDPDTFYRPWRTYQRYRYVPRPLVEDICAENNTNLFDYHIPVAERPDF